MERKCNANEEISNMSSEVFLLKSYMFKFQYNFSEIGSSSQHRAGSKNVPVKKSRVFKNFIYTLSKNNDEYIRL